MPITLDKAKSIGDKKLHFGGDREFSLRGEIYKYLHAKKNAQSPDEVIIGMKIDVKKISAKKVRQALNNLKRDKFVARAVENEVPFYYALEKSPKAKK